MVADAQDLERLGDLVTLTSGSSPSTLAPGKLPYFKVDQLNNSNKYQSETPYHVTYDKPICAGSLVFPKRGAAIFSNKVRILAQPSFIDTNLMAMTVNDPKIVDPEFLYYWLLKYNLGAIADTTSVPQINNKHINPIEISLPPISEQRAIAAALSDADGYIASLEALIAKKRNIKQGAMQELLTGQRRLPGFTGNWVDATFGELGSLFKGRGISMKDTTAAGVPCIMYGDIYLKFNTYFFDADFKVPIAVANKSIRAKTGDLFFTASGETAEEIGKCVVYLGQEDIYIGGDIIAMRPHRNLDSLFLAYLQNSDYVIDQKATYAQGHSVVHINANNIREISVKIPGDLHEQNAIASVLFDLDEEIKKLISELRKVRDIKKGMMQELLTGQIRLVDDRKVGVQGGNG